MRRLEALARSSMVPRPSISLYISLRVVKLAVNSFPAQHILMHKSDWRELTTMKLLPYQGKVAREASRKGFGSSISF